MLNHSLALITKRILARLRFSLKCLGLLYLNLLNRQPTLWYICLFLAGLILALAHHPIARAQIDNQTELDNLSVIWLLVAGTLVFFMNAGFAMLEAGLCQARNAVNVLAKNLIVFCVSILAFWWFGFGIMFGDGNSFWDKKASGLEYLIPPLIIIFRLGLKG